MTNKEEDNLYLAELEAFDKDRLVAWQNLELYHQKIPTIQYTCLASIISKKKKKKEVDIILVIWAPMIIW